MNGISNSQAITKHIFGKEGLTAKYMATLIHHQITEDSGIEFGFFLGTIILSAFAYLLIIQAISSSKSSEELLIPIPNMIEASSENQKR